jgi:hypothetical protein
MSSIAISEPEVVSTPRSLPMPSAVHVLFGLVAVLSLVGAVLSFATIYDVGDKYGAPGDIGVDKKTSFGVVAVEHAEKLSGLNPAALSGASHGVQSLVEEDQSQIQVSISLTNQTTGVVDYSPAQFRLRLGSGSQVAQVNSSTFGQGRLEPHANIEGRMGFVAPQDGRNLTLEFTDPGGKPVTIDLGSANSLAVKAGGGHGHQPAPVDTSGLMPPQTSTGNGVTVELNDPSKSAANAAAPTGQAQ